MQSVVRSYNIGIQRVCLYLFGLKPLVNVDKNSLMYLGEEFGVVLLVINLFDICNFALIVEFLHLKGSSYTTLFTVPGDIGRRLNNRVFIVYEVKKTR